MKRYFAYDERKHLQPDHEFEFSEELESEETSGLDYTDTNEIVVENASIHNLKDISVRIPKGKITVVTGVSGSGKSSLATLTPAVFNYNHPEYMCPVCKGLGEELQIDTDMIVSNRQGITAAGYCGRKP